MVFKQLQQWKEAPVDCMVLALNYLQGYYALEIARGQQNLGNYHLRSEFSSSLATTLFLPDEKVYSPADIVSQIKENIFASLMKVHKLMMQTLLMMLVPQPLLYKVYLRKNVLSVYYKKIKSAVI